ncbi:F-box protein [Cardamine amara subsp. amara]|uniref:F-box protein n=1 Tax=Cardamine amara subsp. amara TaxID=228776 RepID=A0ABD1B1E1_CARAN
MSRMDFESQQTNMETPNSGGWSELPMDILRSVFERMSFVDFHRAKIVCLNWYLCSKQTLPRKTGSPWMILFPEDDGCVLYNPDEARVYRTKRDFSGIRFLANSRNWFLVLDSKSNLYIIDVFSEKRFNLPPLESIKSGHFSLKRVRDKEFNFRLYKNYAGYLTYNNVVDLRGILWVDEKKEEYIVAWFLDSHATFIAFCKNGEHHHRTIPTFIDVDVELQGARDIVLWGRDTLYVYTTLLYIRLVDLSGQEGYKDVSSSDKSPFSLRSPPSDFEIVEALPYRARGRISRNKNIAVTTSGEVLLVESIIYGYGTTKHMIFHLYKKDPNPNPDDILYNLNSLVEVDSLGDDAILLDLGITLHADHSTLGIEPNFIYFTLHDRVDCPREHSYLNICVFNLGTKTLKRFPELSNLKLKDARWFLPY